MREFFRAVVAELADASARLIRPFMLLLTDLPARNSAALASPGFDERAAGSALGLAIRGSAGEAQRIGDVDQTTAPPLTFFYGIFA